MSINGCDLTRTSLKNESNKNEYNGDGLAGMNTLLIVTT